MAVVVGVILGAGSSRRLGRPKQTLALGDTTLLGWVVREAEASLLDRVVVVTRAEIATGRAEVTRPDDQDAACSSSLHGGLEAAGTCDAVMLLLGDMPGVDATLIDTVRAAWEPHRPWGLVTEYDDGLGHPLVFGADVFAELRALHGDKAVWKLVGRMHRSRVARPRPRDVDTWEDYEVVVAALG